MDVGAPISLHVNGCPNSCARIQVADIGLKGQLIKGPDGSEEFAYQVHLGGGLRPPTAPRPASAGPSAG